MYGVEHILYQPTNGEQAFFFCSRDTTDTISVTDTKATLTFLKKRRRMGSLSVFVCTSAKNTRLNVQIEIRKLELGIEAQPTFIVYTCFMYGRKLCFGKMSLDMGGYVGNETDIGLLR